MVGDLHAQYIASLESGGNHYMERGRGEFNWRWKVGDVHLSSFSSFFFFFPSLFISRFIKVGWVKCIPGMWGR